MGFGHRIPSVEESILIDKVFLRGLISSTEYKTAQGFDVPEELERLKNLFLTSPTDAIVQYDALFEPETIKWLNSKGHLVVEVSCDKCGKKHDAVVQNVRKKQALENDTFFCQECSVSML